MNTPSINPNLVTLIEDDFIRDNRDMQARINQLIERGYIIKNDYQHPAVGRIVELLQTS